MECGFHVKHFSRHALRGTEMVTLPIDRLGTPVAVIRTAAAGDHVEREISVGLPPCAPIRLDIDEVPGRRGKAVQVREQISGLGETNRASMAGPVRDPGKLAHVARGGARETAGWLRRRDLRFSD